MRPEEEEQGTDEAEIGEFTYQEDTVFIPEPIRSNITAKVPEMSAIDDKIGGDDEESNTVNKQSIETPSTASKEIENEK